MEEQTTLDRALKYQFTDEQIAKYKIITKEMAEKEIEMLYDEKKAIDERAGRYIHARADSILIQKIDFRQMQTTLYTDSAKKEGRIINSSFARILSVSPIQSDCEEMERVKAILKPGQYLTFNAQSCYSPNVRDWENNGQYDEIYKQIWIIAVDNILLVDEEMEVCDFYKLVEQSIWKRRNNSLESALMQIEEERDGKKVAGMSSKEREELRTSIFDSSNPDSKIKTKFKGIDTPGFHGYKE